MGANKQLKTLLTLILSGLLLFIHALPSLAAGEFYVTIKGIRQGTFKGELAGEAYKYKIPGLGFEHSVKAPVDTAKGRPSGNRLHQPVTFLKEWGTASPQLMQALVNYEMLSEVVFEFIKTDSGGQEYVYYTIKLTNAMVMEIKQLSGLKAQQYLYLNLGDSAKTDYYDGKELELITLAYQKIEWTCLDGKTTASDRWVP